MNKRRSSGSGRGQSSLGYLFGASNELDQQDSKVISSPTVCNSGGGQSSLGYLFGGLNASSSQESNYEELKLSSSPPATCVSLPPYGTHDDMVDENTTKIVPPPSPLKKDDGRQNPSPKSTCVYHKVDGKNSGDFLITGRPSTRVTSVPGGDSSIGYLFGDK